ncbi:hypothetical protein Val02_11340 [Virgisporangium aliadipatigenens]|uniref:Aminoglycoside phosphotransferase domain-containing protein n=1 Tax=Virgisporangium aliadipatigenens TaxID=741659 RepID=A0A8J4DP45_9ACTN|nr:hypothetical protein Val02_11340 [Virgisporangium aliadipatigenens]
MLVGFDGTDWVLPTVPDGTIAALGEHVRERFGVDVTVTACLGVSGDTAISAWRLYLCEPRARIRLDGPGRWMTAEDLLARGVDAQQGEAVVSWLANGRPSAPVPWERRGWFDEVVNWTVGRLAARGIRITGRPRQRTCTLWSYVLEFPTSAGSVYFKAAPRPFAHEPSLTAMLAEWYPDDMPTVIAVEPTRHWFLTEEIDGFDVLRPEPRSLDVLAQALVRYAGIQWELAARAEALRDAGVPDLRLAVLPDVLESLLDHTSMFTGEAPESLTPGELDALRRCVPWFRGLCRRVAALDIPETLVNTDLCCRNIAFSGAGPVFFDWAESALTTPLCSMRMFLLDVDEAFPDDDGPVGHLRDAYLACWTGSLTLEELRQAYRLAEPVTRVVRAATWFDCLREVPVERRLEWRVAIPRNLRDLLSFAHERSLRP